MQATFIAAIHSKQKVSITFYSKEDQGNIARICAPIDFGPSRKFKDGIDRFHVWDYFPDGGKKPHPIPLEQSQIKSMTVLDETFDPAEFITWSPIAWHVQRDWGRFS